VGCLEESSGDFTAKLTVANDGSSELLWVKCDGKSQKSVPSIVAAKHAEALKDLKTGIKDIQKMLPAQRERLGSLYRFQKSWPLETWRERYLDHPLVGILARRLIWNFTATKKTTAGIWHDGRIVDVNGKHLAKLGDRTTVTLWHPIGQPPD